MLPSQADARCPACRCPVLARQETCGVCGAVPWVHAGYEAARDCPGARCAGGHVREAGAADAAWGRLLDELRQAVTA